MSPPSVERERRADLASRIRVKGNGHRRPVRLIGPAELVVTGVVAAILTDGVRMRGGVFVPWGAIQGIERTGR